ncbi:hypothetical protein [Chryseobacterium daeguense]|nr:hypothetical protein [Chryseobacterium daeguense]
MRFLRLILSIVDGAVIIVEATLHHLGLRKTNKILTQSEMDEEVFICSYY